MKKSISTKIVISYLIIIFASFIFVSMFFNLAANRYIQREARQRLNQNAKVIFNILTRELDSNKVESNIQKVLKDRAILKGIAGQHNYYAIVTTNGQLKAFLPKNADENERFKTQILPNIKLGKEKTSQFSVELDGRNYIGVIYSAGVKGYLVSFISLETLNELTTTILKVLMIALFFTAILALIFGAFFARSIAKPIIKLKKRAELLSKRDFDTKVEINTGDELEELANTINKMAIELKEYDIAQKRFLQNASHELKTPLMSIQGYAEGIKDGVFDSNEQALGIIVEESMRLKRIVDELIFLSKLETMEGFYNFTDESINEIIEKSVEKVKSLAVKNKVNINMMLYKDSKMKVDRDKLTQALINILGNSIRYASSEINVTTSNDGKLIEINIYDDGEGFDEKDIKNIFERFYKGKKGNTGLGLAITKVIIEKHKGTVQAANRKDGGAEFIIRLPIM